ncbi:MAG: TIGR01906 family membrane protein [Clostridiales bacterium]|jgi:integral membrane protein (TIGR01906 family)|nr:TIGR01906 family membrane protein [Clostridiales bacterium]
MLKALAVLNTICLLLVLLCVSVQIPAFNLSFYGAEYDKYNIPAHIQVPRDELMTVTRRLIVYMKGEAPDLVVEAGVAGERREFFNQREKDHMVDVKNLITGGLLIRNIAAAVIVVSLIALCLLRLKFLKLFARAVRSVFIVFLIIASALIAVIASNFDRAFTVFHELFFNNDLWILNPDTDLLVNIVPLGFFMDISATVGAIFAGLCLAVIAVSIIYNRVSGA